MGSSTFQSSIKYVSNDFTAGFIPITEFIKSCSLVALDKSFSGIFCFVVIKSFHVLSKLKHFLLAEMVFSYCYTPANSRTALSHGYHGTYRFVVFTCYGAK